MKISFFVVLIGCSLTTISCKKKSTDVVESLKSPCDTSTPISYDIVGSGYQHTQLSDSIGSRNLVITNNQQWKEFKQLVDTLDSQYGLPNNQSGKFAIQNIDFSKDLVIVAFDSVRPVHGRTIDITSIRNNCNGTLTVTIENLEEDGTGWTMCHPYQVIKLSNAIKNFTFEKK